MNSLQDFSLALSDGKPDSTFPESALIHAGPLDHDEIDAVDIDA
jgi:hypothetical protein